MTHFSLIAAVDENYGLGADNQLLCHLPADLQYFKQITMHKPIIMGKKTYESIGKPLPGRRNIVLTTRGIVIPGVETVGSIAEAIALVTENEEAMVIGGALIFEQFLGLADQIYLTMIHHTFKPDVYFPKLNHAAWQCFSSLYRPHDEKNIYDLTFKHYKKISNY